MFLSFLFFLSFIAALQPYAGIGRLIVEVSKSHTDTPHSVLYWTSDQPVTETCAWQHTTFTRDRHPCSRWDSNPAISVSERPQTYTVDRGTVTECYCLWFI